MKNATGFFLSGLVLGCLAALPAFQGASPLHGTSLYKRRCMMCHGADGKGYASIKTPDFTDPKWQASVKDQELVEVIKNGKKGTHMPAFAEKLGEDEIRAVVGYVRSMNAKRKS